MPTIRNIDDFVTGDTYILDRLILTIPNAATVTEAWWTAKSDYNLPDSSAAFVLNITPTLSASGIIVNNADGSVRLLFMTDPAVTSLMISYGSYYYDVQVLLSDGTLYTPETGKIFTIGSVTSTS